MDTLEQRCEALEDRESEPASLVRELTDAVRILELQMKHTPPVIHFGDHGEELEYDVAEIAYQLFGKRVNASMVRILGIYSMCHAHNDHDNPFLFIPGVMRIRGFFGSTVPRSKCTRTICKDG